MPVVRVSAARIASILRNRGILVADIEARAGANVRVAELVTEDRDVELDDLITLASLLNRPWPYLAIDEPEAPPPTGQDHRTTANQHAGITAALVAELESAAEMLESASELFPERIVRLPRLDLRVGMNVEAAGASVRAALAVTVDEQRSAEDQYAALRLWVGALHEQNIFVAQRRLEDETVRAFSLRREGRCVVVVDTQDTPYARVFSIVHEYVHVAMRSTGLCDLDDRVAVERFCNAVAAAVLLPQTSLADERARRWGLDAEEDDTHLRDLSRREHVSQAVSLIRLRDVGIVSQTAFDALDQRRLQRRSDRTSGGTYYPTQINRVGRLFAGEVLRSFDSGWLGRQDAAALLGIGEHNVNRYRREFATAGRRAG